VKQREISQCEADSDAFLSLAGYSMEKESRSEFFILILSNGNWDLGESASDTRMESSVEIEIS